MYAMVMLHNVIKYIQQILIEFRVVVSTILVVLNVKDVATDLCSTSGNAPLLTIFMPVKSATALTTQKNAIMMKKFLKRGKV